MWDEMNLEGGVGGGEGGGALGSTEDHPRRQPWASLLGAGEQRGPAGRRGRCWVNKRGHKMGQEENAM